jgi:putative ABC transport system permease protein
MVISVLERCGEVGLRRALGATRGHITTQFLTESAVLAALGGIAGLAFGALATCIYAHTKIHPFVIPTWALIAAPACRVRYRCVRWPVPREQGRASQPTEALRT